jgi:lambda repressor-like predicted transcriptional regulator
VILTVGALFSGKTDIAKVLEGMGFQHVSTKELLLAHRTSHVDTISSGGVASDDELIEAFSLRGPREGNLNIDSFRSLAQAKWALAKRFAGAEEIITLHLKIEPEVIWHRLAARVQQHSNPPGR